MKNKITPEERIASEIWFVLNEVKSRILRLDTTENISMDVIQLLHTSNEHPFASPTDLVKIMDKLSGYGVLYEYSSRDTDIFNTGTAVLMCYFSVNVPTFEEVYNDYEYSFSNTLFGDPITFSAPSNSTLKLALKDSKLDRRLIEMIARKMGEASTGPKLIKLMQDCDVPEDLIEYPNTKWRMLDDVFNALYFSDDSKNEDIVLKVIQESTHPIMHNSDFELARGYEKDLNDILRLANYQIKNFKIGRVEEYKAFTKPKTKRLQNGPLVLNPSEATLTYMNTTVDISLKSHEIKFLSHLLENVGKVVDYTSIAKKLDLNVYHPKVTNNDVVLRKAVNYKKRDLKKMLENTSFSKNEVEEIMSLIKPQQELGYKMIPYTSHLKKRSHKQPKKSKTSSKTSK